LSNPLKRLFLQALAATRAESERYLVQSLESDWESAKQAFLRGPALPNPLAYAAAPTSSTPYAQTSAPVSLARNPPLATPKMNVYASALEDLISSTPSLQWASSLASAVAAVADDATGRDLAQTWALVTALARVRRL